MKWIGTQTIYDSVRFKKPLDIAGDVTLYQPVNNANPAFSIGSSDDERFRIKINYKGTTTQEAQIVTISSITEGSTADDGRFQFKPDESHVLDIDDGGIDFKTGFGISINGADIITDSSGTATLSNIDAIDATTVSTLNAALTAGDITGVTAGTNLSGGGTSGAVTINLANASTSVLGAASFSSDNFAASSGAITIKSGGVDLTDEVTGVLPSANMDGDTAHLTTTQTFTGAKTFTTNPVIFDGDKNVTPGDGAVIHVDAHDVTDIETSASGTTAAYTHVNIEAPRLLATNSSVTTTDAATLYIKSAPVASTNQTITNAYALWVDAGNARFDGNIDLEGDIDVNGTLETDALTVGGTNVLTGSLITTLGTISAGVWNGTAIASAYLDSDTAHLSGTQTFTGTKTLNSFKGTGGATVTNILDEDAMGSDSATALATQQSIKAYADTKVSSDTTKQFTYHQFTDDTATTKIYLGLQEADAENTNTTNKFLPLVFPLAGKLLKVFLRSNKNLSSHTLTWRLETQATGVAFGTGPSVVGTQSGGGCTQLNMTTYDFTSSLDSGTNAIAANAMVYLSIQSDTDFGSNVIYYVTCLWEADLS